MPGLTHNPAHMAANALGSPGATPDAEAYGVRSIGVALQAPRLQQFLEQGVRLWFLPPGAAPSRGVHGLAGWGAKGSARHEASRRGMPYLALEDGFLRTAGLGGRRDRSLSLTADFTGVHYDASQPSDLEALIEDWAAATPEDLADAERLIAIMRDANLGKFNGAPDLAPDDPLFDEPPVLVVDQIAGDKSIAGGGCSAATFGAMLDAAVAENPGRRVVARVHPFDGVGGRKGHLKALALARGLDVHAADVSWMSMAKRAARVYVATSHAGLEALIAGAAVTCFGMPAYAGWGLTDDRSACPRRCARPTLGGLIAAIYLRYSRYLSPLDGMPCTALDVARLLAARRRRDSETAGLTHVIGVQPWKRMQIEPFVQGRRSRVTWTMNPTVALARQGRQGGRVAVWASRELGDLDERCRAQGAALVRFEDGFVRSIGLGANLELPSSLVLDTQGIYYDPAAPSALESLLQTAVFTDELRARAAALRGLIVEREVSKYNVGDGGLGEALAVAGGRPRVLVPAQVANDASVVRGGGRVRDNLALLKAVREARPDGFIVFKPHPDVEAGIRPGALPDAQVLRYADVIAPRRSITRLLAEVDEVHTITSLAGFEALIRGVPVFTYGLPFYCGWGLTQDRESLPRRTRTLGLDELAAGVLIMYPRYVHRPSGWPCEAEDVVRHLSASLQRVSGAALLKRRRTAALIGQGVRRLFG